ncbi:glutathione S-transferase Mu 1-like [Xenia sp. Carnegie-2017]|uniref:glutathione S-transferase Mu 1-like n=1 Tax=Xenia sp. Carnegie-2017 TaxID=2897299 RepID=UPI001F050397|nr:glutathione S-transferase Mu 1-like [Xenia sp. Carnegie-2017]
MKMAPILGYWNMRGLAQPIRFLLAYTSTEYEDKRYTCGPPPDYNREDWLKEKENLGLDFPNLPYFIDGDTKITQSSAIIRYIARKHNLCGETDEEKAIVDMIENCTIDLRIGFVRLCYSSDFDKLVDGYKKNVVEKLDRFEKFLGDKKYLAGEKVTYPDFMLYEMLDQHKIFDKKLVEPFKKLMQYCDTIEAIPQIAEYKKSNKFQERPLNNPRASFK